MEKFEESVNSCIDRVANTLYLLTNSKKLMKGVGVDSAIWELKAAQQAVRELDDALIKTLDAVADAPLTAFPSKELLREFAPEYFHFDSDDRKKWTWERACYRLATWLYDSGGKRKVALKKIEDKFGAAVAAKVKKFYKDGNHDT